MVPASGAFSAPIANLHRGIDDIPLPKRYFEVWGIREIPKISHVLSRNLGTFGRIKLI